MSRLSLRKISRREAELRQQIGAGCCYPYWLDGEQGMLRLTLADERQPGEMSRWRCDVGNLQLDDAQGVLSLMSAAPTFALTAETAEQQWYWPWWQSQLSGELLTLFGHITVTEETAAAEFLLLMTLEWREMRGQSLLRLSADSLAQLLNTTGWHRERAPIPADLGLVLPLVIGNVVLPPARLKPGDVVLPQQRFFTPDGRGAVRCAGRLLHGQLHTDPMTYFYLSEMENYDVTLPPDEFEQSIFPESSRDGEAMSDAADFSVLPLALSVRCGQLRLTLGELGSLAPGATVMIDNVTPGEALLCHGDYPLAKGELVEVEGRLGLQITHMLSGSANPLAR